MAFDYGGHTVAFGSNLDAADASEIERCIEQAAGAPIERGKADMPRPEKQRVEVVAPPPKARAPAPATKSPPLTWWSPSSLLLIAANLVPIAGTVFLGWRLGDVMVLYWAESAVIGFFNVLKIVLVSRWYALVAAPFFVGHFGGFMAIHFLFIYTLFVQGIHGKSNPEGDLGQVAALFAGLWPALLALFVSHGYSFFANFVGRREYLVRTAKDQMSEPYSRIVFMHLVLIFGGGLTMVLGDPTPVLLIVIALKIWFDLRAHLKQHSVGED